MKLNFRQLQAFITVARLGSFTRAADEIHITQAGLSLMIKEAEEQLGYRLFDRTTRSVRLTPAGARFLPVVARAMQEIDDMAGLLARDQAEAHRYLRVAATPLVCGSILPAVIREIRADHPHFRILVRDVERPAVQPLLESGEVDLALGILLKAASGLHRQSLHPLSLLCVAPRRKRTRAGREGRTVRWSELTRVPLIGLPFNNVIQQFIDRRLEALGRAGEERLVFHNMLTIIAMVESGLGWAVLPSFVRAACSRYDVQVADLIDPREHLDMYAISRRGVAPSAVMPVFLDTFTRHLAALEATPRRAA